MKRPSDVPPVHESSGATPVDVARSTSTAMSTSLPARRQERLAVASPRDIVVEAMRVEHVGQALARAIRGVLAVE